MARQLIVDVGAHLGESLPELHGTFNLAYSDVVAWEPNKACHRHLRRELAKWGGELLPWAAGAQDGEGRVTFPDRWQWLWGRKRDNVQVRPGRGVPVRSLPDWLEAHAGREIHLKLDAEGAEWLILDEVLKRPAIALKTLLVEWHPWIGLSQGLEMGRMVAIQEAIRQRFNLVAWR